MNTKNYSKDVNFSGKTLILIILLSLSFTIHSQVRVNFTPREAIASPSTSIYNIKGDFTIIGNTNLTLNNYDVNEPNSNNNMVYVDVDGNSNTFNSSSANLTFSTENGAIPECSKIVFAGLYWTGRASDGSNSPDTFNVTKNSVTKTLNKRKVQLKGPSAATYTEITAGTNDIYYPQTNDGFMYSAFAEITEYVKTNGLGQYTVADIALVEGNGGGTGYYGGWGIIVVYENSKMKWRDITIFDGHAYVQGSTTVSHQIPISGFNAVQTGQVNIKLGLMAGEGDRSISGDYFNILRSSDNNWQALNHTGNATNNFFNSSIQTGGNTRNPNLVNNTGLDISMFNIPNPGNTVIANNQTSTTLRYGSTQDTYVIFMAAMAVDAYIPDPEGVMSLVTINGLPATSTTTVTPGQEIEYSIKILNEGTESINNTQIKIQLPYTTTFVNGSQSGIINFSPLPTPNNVYFNPSDGPSGSLIWDIGTLPVPSTPTTVLGELKYKVRITEDCFLLKNPNCVPSASLYGFINGVGAVTGIQIINKPFIQGYVSSGLCLGDPILDPITTTIDATNFINQNCQNTNTELVFNYCSPISQVPFNSIASNYPIGTQFYNSYPVTGNTMEYTSSNPFPNTLGSFDYYAVPPNANGCYYTLQIIIVGNPTITSPQSVNLNGCNTSILTPLVYSETPINISLQDFINAGGNVSNNQLNYNISYVDTTNGNCPLVVTRTFTIITSCSTQTIRQIFNINDDTDPTITTQASNLEVQCDGSGNTAQLNAWLASNGGAVASDVCSNVTWSNNFASVSDTCGATGSATVTFTATDACGNTSTTSATFTIIDDTDPTITTQAANLEVQCDGSGNTAQLNAWLASNGGAVASDVCSNVTWTNNFASVSDTCGATGSATVTFTATDACGNTSTTSATFTIIDDTDPTITTQAANLEVQCDGSGNTAQLNAWLASNGGAVASDVCSNVTWTNNFASVSDTCGATGSATVTFTATDDCGNASTTSATFTIIDDTDPTITTQAANLEVQCDGAGNTAQLNAWLASNGGAVASDVCSNVTWTNNFASVSDTCGATGSATVTFTATDDCGNASTTSATFTIIDDTDPVISVQASNLEVQCDGSGNTAQLNAWLASNGGAVASDVCSNVTWTNNFASVSDTCGATGSATVTFTATDDCGNASTTSATFTIIDDTDPVISVQASNLEVQCDGAGNTAQLNAWLASNGGAVASDVCSNVTWTNNFASVSDTCGATGSATVTFTATDNCGNASTTSATFTIIDDTDPTITTQPANLELQCDGSGNTAQLNAWLASNGGAVASDVCSNVTWTNNFASVSDTCGATGSATVTFTATDDCGNASTTSATFTIIDDTDPVISVQASNLEVQCDGAGNTSQLNAWLTSNGGAVASDICSNVTWTNNFASVSDTCGATGSATVTFTATDACGNTSTTSATFTIIDDTDPTITTQAANLEVQCDGSGNTAQLNAWLASNGGAVASDVCSNVTWTNNFASVSDTCGATGSASVIFTATDACGNSSTTSATFTIIDDTDPTITTQAANLEVQCDGSGNTAQLNAWLASNGGAVASDVCSNVTWTNNFASVSDTCGATGSASVIFTATDACGNSSTTSATFTIIDDTDPTITTQAANLEVQCDGSGNTAQLNAWLASNGGAVASDVCSNVTWTNNFASVSDTCGATGSASVIFTATDACGNSSTTSATFTIIDDTDPTITTQAANLEVQCDGSGNTAQLNAWLASNGGAVASDVCSNVTWSNNFASVSDTCGATGSATVTFTATDNCGNSSTTSATFTIIDDTDPTITNQAANLEVQCDGSGNTTQLNAWLASNGGAVASDVCSNVTWSNNFASVSDTCGATGSASVIFTATDACGNSSTTSATFTIIDDTDPTITTQAANLEVQCDGAGNTAQLNAWLASNGGAVASDVCSNVTWSNNFASVSDTCGATGSATVTFTATDACGNSSTTSATFTIIDDTDPTITTQASNLEVQCDGAGNTAQLNAWLASNGGAVASDVCSNVTWTNNFASVSDTCGATGSATVTFTATDACGNASTTSATFTIIDDTDPTITTQAANLEVQCDGAGNTSQLNAWLTSNGGAVASDICSNVTWTNNFASVSDTCGATGSVSVTFTATDNCGNSSSTTATFTIIDNTNPTITTQASNLEVQCDGNGNTAALNAWLASNGGASATDVCSSVTWSNNFTSVSDTCGATGSASVTFTATDNCGNSSSTTATFTIIDNTNPTITTQASNLEVQCDGAGNTAALNAWLASNGGAAATDVCSSVTWSNNFTSVSDTCGATGSASVTFTATDNCGNSSSTTATFTIIDDTDPIFTSELPQDISVSCDAIPNPANMTGSDNCSDVTITVLDTIDREVSQCEGEYIISRTWTITDSCNNSSNYTQTITVFDNTPPILITPLDAQISALCSEIPEIPQLVFTDNCSGIQDVVFNETSTIISIYSYVIVREWVVSDNCGNEANFTQTINVSVEEPFDAIPFAICIEENPIDLFTILDDSIPTTGTWIEVTSSGGLTGSIFNPSNVTLGYYTLRYIVELEDNACPMIYEIYLNVNDDCVVLPACDITVYNAVSPNDDSSNDFFFIDGLECYPDNTVEIYNRWGILVYSETGYDNNLKSFKGISEGRNTINKNELLPDGTYFYILKYTDEENKNHDRSGYLYLNR